jgi:hypothetical protein
MDHDSTTRWEGFPVILSIAEEPSNADATAMSRFANPGPHEVIAHIPCYMIVWRRILNTF